MTDNYEGNYPEYLMPGVRILRATREPCLVCGHATGDCSGPSGAPHTIFGANIKTENTAEPMVLVGKSIYGERQITPFTKARVLLAAAGSYIPAAKARELGLL